MKKRIRNTWVPGYAGLLLILAWGWAALPVGAQSRNRPPIIMAALLRYDAVGPSTPHIRSLMQDGVTFCRAYCAAPLCAPSKAAVFKGLTPNRTGSSLRATAFSCPRRSMRNF